VFIQQVRLNGAWMGRFGIYLEKARKEVAFLKKSSAKNFGAVPDLS
jgi:hypothetical protein